jgi:hypothetical protein
VDTEPNWLRERDLSGLAALLASALIPPGLLVWNQARVPEFGTVVRMTHRGRFFGISADADVQL